MSFERRFCTEHGPEVFTGNEALIKGALEAEGGVHLLAGYPGSPVAGYFDSLSRLNDLMKRKGIRCAINNNEALAAAMVNGSQALPVRSMIVMKSVGLHVASDALAMGNLAGANREGGAIVVCGDDPWSDSTQVTCDSRFLCKHLFMPVLEPSSPQEIKDFIDLAFKLSARSELFAGLIITTNLADGGGTVECKPNHYPRLNTAAKTELDTSRIDISRRVMLPPATCIQEKSFTDRHARAMQAARELGINRIEHKPVTGQKAPIGFVATGVGYGYLVQALHEMQCLGKFPIAKLGLSYPVDPTMIRELSEQCERIVVVEERRGFMEEQIAAIITADAQSGGPLANVDLWGKTAPEGLEPIPHTLGLHPSMLIDLLGPLIQKFEPAAPAVIDEVLATVDATQRVETDNASIPTRIPSFCPGCPHRDTASLCLEIKRRLRNASYMRDRGREPVDLMFHGDTGCYTMLVFPPNNDLMHDCSGMGLGGGTASGVDSFITNKEVVFMGDSTFYHSGMIAISQAVNLKQDITFIILDNATTAMTGHQPQPGNAFDLLGNPTPQQNIEDIVRGIGGELGVPVMRVDPERRNEYRELLEETFLADGVKVIIADKECGITLNRRRKRAERDQRKEKGFLPQKTYMNINEDICRFCLACSEMTGCPGLRHVETDYGRKMDTDASWCVNDGCCQRIGACDAFEQVTVYRKNAPKSKVPELDLDNIPDPIMQPSRDVWQAVLTGVGGMGIGLATSILVRAGHNEGHEVEFLDKKGLAIRNGGVVSQVLFNLTHQPLTPIISYGTADLLLGVDVLEAARLLQPAHRFRVIGKDRTTAVINTDKIATIGGLMGREDYDPDQLVELIRTHTRSEEFLARNISRICESYLGSKLYANVMMMGYAFQQGVIPVSMDSIARAIKDSIRVDFEKNLFAFNMGRKLVVAPELFQGPPSRDTWRDMLEDRVRWTTRRFGKNRKLGEALQALATEYCEHMSELDEKTLRQFVVHLYDCIRWGRSKYAQQYADLVRKTYDHDRGEYGFAATTTVIRHLAGAMLIKDTIYKAELATGPEKIARDRRKYNVNPNNGDRMVYKFLFHRRLKFFGKQRNVNIPVGTKFLRWLRSQRWTRGWITNKYNLRYRDNYIDLVEAFDYDSADAYQQTLKSLSRSSCMHCLTPTCGDVGCPLHNDIPVWMAHAADGDYKAAIDRLHATNNFPEFTAAICPAPCQESCKRARRNMPVPIQTIEQEIVDKAFAGGYITPQKPAARREQTVAVVGSGPAGLAAAQQLTRNGYQVTVFERDDQPGGLLRYGIPEHRLSSDIIDRRITQLKAEGTQFALSTAIGQTISGHTLRADFDAICLAVGTPASRDLDLPGRELGPILYATDFLRSQHDLTIGEGTLARGSAPAAGKHVVVIGGGLTGEDCAEAAIAQGAASVTLLEIRPEAPSMGTLPGTVEMKTSTRTVAFESDGDGLSHLRIVGVKYIPSAAGPVIEDMPDTEQRIPADLAILAAGFLPSIDTTLAEQLDLACDDAGRLLVNEQFATTAEGVFAAGDVVTSAAYVATAIHSGRKCAKRIHQYIQTHIEA